MGASKRLFEDVRINNAVVEITTTQRKYNEAKSTTSQNKGANIKTKTK